MAPIVTFVRQKTGEAVTAKGHAEKMEKQLDAKILDADMKHVTRRSVSSPSRTDSAPDSLRTYIDSRSKADRRRAGHYSGSSSRHRRHWRDEKRSSTSSRWAKSDKSTYESAFNRQSNHNRSRRVPQVKEDKPRVIRPVNKMLLIVTTISLPKNGLSMMNMCQGALLNGQNDYTDK